jgi:hypothetical protein
MFLAAYCYHFPIVYCYIQCAGSNTVKPTTPFTRVFTADNFLKRRNEITVTRTSEVTLLTITSRRYVRHLRQSSSSLTDTVSKASLRQDVLSLKGIS